MEYSVHEKYSYADPRKNSSDSITSDNVVIDFSDNVESANNYLSNRVINSTHTCFLNPEKLTDVRMDLSFTVWKWIITAIFGMLPLFITIVLLLLIVYPHVRKSISEKMQYHFDHPPPPYER